MKIPRFRKLKLSTWRYKEIVNLKDDHGNKCFGLCDFESKTIYIEKRQGRKQKQDSYLHENLHAIFCEIEVGLSFDREEEVVSELCAILQHLFCIKAR